MVPDLYSVLPHPCNALACNLRVNEDRSRTDLGTATGNDVTSAVEYIHWGATPDGTIERVPTTAMVDVMMRGPLLHETVAKSVPTKTRSKRGGLASYGCD